MPFFKTLGLIFLLLINFLSPKFDKIASAGGRVNILVMGKAGTGRSADSPDLTDTMILASVGISKPNIILVSIPRDLWIPELRAKVNAAYFWGGQNTPYVSGLNIQGGKIGLAKLVVGKISGQPVQYGIVIDFSGFRDIVDAIGGIQVDVDNSFTDKFYPIEGRENDACGGDPSLSCRYETVTFNKGSVIMDGETALKFVRSRRAEGIEGTDLARESRQQKVIAAIKNKITDPKIFLSPKVTPALIGVFKNYVETDIDAKTGAILARLAVNDYKNISQNLIPENLLINPPVSKIYDNQYVFIPKAGNGNWGEINKWFTATLY